METLSTWIDGTRPVEIGLTVLLGTAIAAFCGFLIRGRLKKSDGADGGQEGYIVSAMLGLMALLLGFTFSMAIDRFDNRRARVLEEANAIGTTYLRAQLLNEPHRRRISGQLVHYVDTRIALAQSLPGPGRRALLVDNDRTLTELWAATSAAYDDNKGYDFSSEFIEGMNELIDLDAARKASYAARVPAEVVMLLGLYVIITAAILGYVLTNPRSRFAGGLLLVLFAMALTLILDLDRPAQGWVRESQRPMEQLRASLATQPPEVFDRWRTPQALAASRVTPVDSVP